MRQTGFLYHFRNIYMICIYMIYVIHTSDPEILARWLVVFISHTRPTHPVSLSQGVLGFTTRSDHRQPLMRGKVRVWTKPNGKQNDGAHNILQSTYRPDYEMLFYAMRDEFYLVSTKPCFHETLFPRNLVSTYPSRRDAGRTSTCTSRFNSLPFE